MTISKLSLDQLRMCSEIVSDIVEYFLPQIYFYLNNDSTIAPNRKIIHQKAALVNLNSYLSTVDLTNRKLCEEHERFLIEGLKGSSEKVETALNVSMPDSIKKQALTCVSDVFMNYHCPKADEILSDSIITLINELLNYNEHDEGLIEEGLPQELAQSATAFSSPSFCSMLLHVHGDSSKDFLSASNPSSSWLLVLSPELLLI
ncbi:hypothetical protein ACTXT7_001625 [Hymenolepis weldensis]